ncbi:uncharacterized protein LOC129586098 [Paramacrobiotus metropolitanus]|uniref:uncharacterized protein LOC129586098 n=1 Tax=Paramacrobiotus metropolitanus TaxID=2943436 RepID=UPI0024457E13|nr:uncharacterized protein LOC129586098 [Paramacrobiotus metropolitanus]
MMKGAKAFTLSDILVKCLLSSFSDKSAFVHLVKHGIVSLNNLGTLGVLQKQDDGNVLVMNSTVKQVRTSRIFAQIGSQIVNNNQVFAAFVVAENVGKIMQTDYWNSTLRNQTIEQYDLSNISKNATVGFHGAV